MNAETEAGALSCEHLTIRYGRTRVLEDVSFVVPARCVYALLGRNGAGKSSLVRCLVGQQRATAGRAVLFGRDGRLYARWDEDAARERLRRFAIPMDTSFGRLSKGQRGAVQLALALGHAPELLILDDPTLGLDLVARDQVFGEIIGELADRGTTVLVTTHDLAAIEGIADRVGVLYDGRLVLDEPLEAMKERFALPLERIFAEVTGASAGGTR
ncbi:MAG: hypothetical protein DMF77_01190 [Acidobacteria bacterium]|nr:MAG: hypothetical protein DMF77_01190 [Acidobacteriota bacterium]